MQSSPVLEQNPPGISAHDGLTEQASKAKAAGVVTLASLRDAATGVEAPQPPGAQSMENSPQQSHKPRLVDMLESEKQFLMHSNVGEKSNTAPDKLLVNLRVIAEYKRREADALALEAHLDHFH